MLHKSKGQYKFQNKATFSIEYGLNPIILAYLKQLLTNKDRDCFGIPAYYMEKQAKIQGLDSYWENIDEVDTKAAFQLRMDDLQELIWVFSQTIDDEPDMEDFGLYYDWGGDLKNGFKRVETKPDAFNNYVKACEEYQERKGKAYRLFGEVYSTLDW